MSKKSLTVEQKVALSQKHWIPEKRWYTPPVVWAVASSSKLLMKGLNRVQIEGQERLERALARPSRGLLTFSNHVSLFDDPWLLSCIAPISYDTGRWIPADAMNFFSTPLLGRIFSCGKCVPIVRGAGLDQPGFHFLIERLKANEWVHIFPEGGRTRDPESRLRHPFKTGIGRLIEESRCWLLPFYHQGMESILPIGGRFPRIGKRVLIHIGELYEADEGFLQQQAEAYPAETLVDSLTTWAYETLKKMEIAIRDDSA